MNKILFGGFLFVALMGLIAYNSGYQLGEKTGHDEMSKWYEQTYYTNCKTAATWQMTDWNIKCDDGYIYSRLEPKRTSNL